MPDVAGLVLAAGRGTRYGGPKALATTADGRRWLTVIATTLGEAGLPVTAVIPADLPEAAMLLPRGAASVAAPEHSGGLSASLTAGLDALAGDPDTVAVLITTVDQPGLPLAAVERVLAPGCDASVLRRAVYRGRPGHPVLIGRAHWAPLRNGLTGDRGAGPYLASAGAASVECSDLWSGDDIDSR